MSVKTSDKLFWLAVAAVGHQAGSENLQHGLIVVVSLKPTLACVSMFLFVSCRLSKLGRALPWQERSAVLKDTNFILLLDRLVRQAPLLNPFQLSTSLYSCAVLQIPLYSLKTGTFSLLLPALEAAVSAQLKQFNDRDVSSTLYAYAQLKPHTAVDAQRKQQSYSAVLQLAGQAHSLVVRKELSGQSISMVLWSLATLHSSNSSSSSGIAAGSSAVVAAATEQLLQNNISFDQLGSQVVANSIWAAEKLGHHNLQLLQKGCDWMAHNPQKCKVQEVLNVLWAAGAARYRPKMLGTLAKHIAGQSKVSRPSDLRSDRLRSLLEVLSGSPQQQRIGLVSQLRHHATRAQTQASLHSG